MAGYDLGDLVGASEIAERLGLTSSSVIRDWKRRHPDFPAPVLETEDGTRLALARCQGLGRSDRQASLVVRSKCRRPSQPW